MMKFKFKAIVVCIFMMIITVITGLSAMTGIAFADSNSGDFKNGYGTAESPYEITSVEEFNNVRYHLDAHFKQIDNLDFGGREFAPIGSVTFPFTGHYDGGKYQISNINIKQNSNNVGLFAFIDNGGAVENLKVANANIEGEYNVGAIAGTNRGTVVGCVSSANVYGNGAVGGIVGLNAVGGRTMECGNQGVISSVDPSGMYVGGIVGVNNALIQNCYNQGNINSDENSAVTYSGGIVGLNDGGSYNAEIEYCYNIGTIIGKARGQVAGDNLSGKISDCKWLASELNKAISFDSGSISSMVVLGQNEFTSASSFNGWDFNNTWMYIKNKSEYPLLNREYVQVESVSFEKSKIEIQPGNSVEINTIIKPIHATENSSKLVLNSNVPGVTLSNNILSIAKSVEPNTVIRLTAKAENKTAELTVNVVKIPVESVKLVNLDGKNEISQLQGLHFNGEIYPEDASYKGIEYKVNSSFATITRDGFLSLKENTPTGIEIVITATSVDNPMKSDSITIKVVKEPVTSVKFSSDNSFKVTGSLKLSADVLPEQATFKDVTYKIVDSTAEGASLTNNVLTAKGVGKITVIAEADGIKSEEFTVEVLKEPVTEIIWNIPENLTCGDILVLNATAVPDNATSKDIQYSIIGDNTAQAKIVDGILYAETAGTVTVLATADEYLSRREITVDKVPVDEIGLDFADSFKHTESLNLAVSVAPENATYKDAIIYDILSDSADSRIESGVLYAKNPGSVTVKVTVDGISAEKTISVLKEAVQSVSLNAAYRDNDFGEVYQFGATIYPSNATFQDTTYVLKSGDATLTATGLLLINPSVPIGSLVEVYAVVDGVESSVYQIKSGRISVKSVSLFADSKTMKVGEGVSLVTSTVPAVVSNPGVSYVVEGNAEVIDGILYVFDTEAVGTTINVKAVVDGVESNTVSVNVLATPVENLTFTCASTFKVTESLKLMTSVYPQNATDKTVTFEIISGQDLGAYIVDEELFAEKVGVVTVKATAGDISRNLVICVQKEPVTRVVLTSSLTVKVNNELKLAATAYPFNATYSDITYKLINNEINAEILDGNIFFSSQVGKVTLLVTADGLDKDYVIEVTKEPVTGIVFAKTAFKHTESLELVTRVLPTNATYSAVTYSILKDYSGYEDIGAYIENGKLYAREPGLIKLLVVTDNGEYSEPIEIEVTKEPVIGITMADYGNLYLDYGYRIGQIDLGTVVYPSTATYKSVMYSFETNNCTYTLNGQILTVTLKDLLMDGRYAADAQASIIVNALADGVEYSKTYVFRKKELVDKSEITFNSNGDTFKTSGKFDFNISLPDKTTYKGIEVTIGGDAKNIGAQLTNNGGTYSIVANYPGKIVVHVTSLCNGISNDFEIDVAKEDVRSTVLGLQVKQTNTKLDNMIYKEGEETIEAVGKYKPADTSDWKSYSGIEVQQGSEIMFRGFGYAENKALPVTYGSASDFALRFYKDNSEITDKNILKDYFSEITDSKITINLNAPVTSEIYVCAVANNGLESKRTKLVIQFAFINEIKSLHITEDGVITGLESICGEDVHEDIEKVSITIKHSGTGITLKKEIYTQFPTIILQLYNRTMGGYFDVEYEIFFKQTLSDNSIHKYSYKRNFKKEGSNDNSFKGLSGYYSYHEYPSKYSSIVWLDNYSNTSSTYEFKSEVKAVYVYSSYDVTRNTSFIFNNDSDNSTDLYLDNYSFNSTAGYNAINVYNSGDFNLISKGTIQITAANGANGLNVLNMPYANLTINNYGSLTLTAGNGADGTDGTSYNRTEQNGGSGTAPSGGAGTSGGNGGIAIYAYNLTLSTSNGSLNIQGGKGGNGGTGGNGHGSDRDGRPKAGNGGAGGDGGAGGIAIKVTNSFSLTVETNSINISAGNGGAGGYGGHGGHGRDSHYADDGGDGGKGGAGGYGGNAIQTNSLNLVSYTARMSIKTGDGGRGGQGGQAGNGYDSWGDATNGTGGNGGNSGNSGSVSVTNFIGDKSAFNNSISIGNVYAGGMKGANGSGEGKAATGTPVNGQDGKMGSKVA